MGFHLRTRIYYGFHDSNNSTEPRIKFIIIYWTTSTYLCKNVIQVYWRWATYTQLTAQHNAGGEAVFSVFIINVSLSTFIFTFGSFFHENIFMDVITSGLLSWNIRTYIHISTSTMFTPTQKRVLFFMKREIPLFFFPILFSFKIKACGERGKE